MTTLADDDVDRCRICGCTDEAACPGGCSWVPDPLMAGELCSSCAAAGLALLEALRPAHPRAAGSPCDLDRFYDVIDDALDALDYVIETSSRTHDVSRFVTAQKVLAATLPTPASST